MNLRLLACATLAMTVLLSSSFAQDEGGRRQRGGGGGPGGGGPGGGGPGGGGPGGGFGGMMGMGMRGGSGGAGTILNMLRMEEVRNEVGVSEDVYKTVSETLQDDMRKLFQRDISEEERKKISDEVNAKAQEMMEEILPPEKQLRLKGLFAQRAGASAVLNTVIAKEIGLSDGDRAGLEKELQAEMTKVGEKMREQFAGGGERPDFAKIQEAMTKVQEDTSKFVDSKLTADQKSALEKLKGEKFKFPEQRGFGGFGGGDNGGNRGGRPGRGGEQGGRPRGDGN